MKAEEALFEVTDHLTVTGRGVFLIGNIRDGVLRPGSVLHGGGILPLLTIRGIDYADRISERKFSLALSFREDPTLDQLRQAFPVGTMIRIEEP